jgi:hypothetical protein
MMLDIQLQSRVRVIPLLLKGELVATAVVDSADYYELSKHTWSLHSQGYACSYRWEGGKCVAYLMHRVVMGEVPEGMHVDHINDDRLDNRRGNLQPLTPRDNTQKMWARRRARVVTMNTVNQQQQAA